MTIKFTIPGQPEGKQRPKFNGKTKTAYTPKATQSYETYVALCYKANVPNLKFSDNDCIDIAIDAYYKIPTSANKKQAGLMESGTVRPTVKPDWDNIGKIICDALNGVAYHDDKQIVTAQVRKFYSRSPRVEVTLCTVGAGT